MTIQWTPDLATGLTAVDTQHQELYRQVAGLHDAMRSGQLEQVPALLGFLQRYAIEHFAGEERAMTRAAYPGLAAHKAAHKAFVDQFLPQKAVLEAGVSAAGVVQLSSWLGAWLRDHVRGVDMEMARWLAGQVR